MKAILPSLVAGLSAYSLVNATATTRYVDLNSTNSVVPYTSWATAATNIQRAVNLSQNGDLILVNDGVYQEGTLNNPGTYPAANRVYVNRAVTVRSVNGPDATFIVGSTNASSRVRCVYLIDGASISGFTLTNGAVQYGAGGVESSSGSAVISNCTIVGIAGTAVQSGSVYNSIIRENRSTTFSFGVGAYQSRLSGCLIVSNYSSYRGGGAGGSSLTNCVVVGNYAGSFGGGLDNCTAINCTIVGNTAHEAGGGADGGRLTNCIVYYNSTEFVPNSAYTNLSSTLNVRNCATTPIPNGGVNCFTTPPAFVNLLAGNLRLQSNSPCINTGFNVAGLAATDKDGRPRLVATTVDIGAYEYQGSNMESYIAWLAEAGLPTQISSDTADPDGDGANSWQEWRANTIPTNAASALRMAGVVNSAMGLEISWESVATRDYWLERATNLGFAAPFETVATNITGVAGTKTYTDSTATNGGPYLYRVGVQ